MRRLLTGPIDSAVNCCHPIVWPVRRARKQEWHERVTVVWRDWNHKGCFSSWHLRAPKVELAVESRTFIEQCRCTDCRRRESAVATYVN